MKRASKETAALLALSIAIALVGCSKVRETPASQAATEAPFSTAPAARPGLPSGPSAPASVAAVAPPEPSPPRFTLEEARDLLFPEGKSLAEAGCPASDVDEAIRCLIAARYAGDARGLETGRAFYDEIGSIPGVEREQTMDGGFRGMIHIVPERPIGHYQKHFDWALEAQRDIQRVFEGVEARATRPMRYRALPLGFKFFRSVGRTTPSAYVRDFLVAYNVMGSLNTSMPAVRETLVHEIFHANDAAAGNWSRAALGDLVDGIVAKCGTRVACLKPYAPMKTLVKNGTYYAFQPDNGDAVHEYAAELASRYYLETRAALMGEKLAEKPFKCGPKENAESFRAIVDQFFGGVDLSPSCASSAGTSGSGTLR